MRVVLISKALVVGAYQKKAEEIARLGIDLTVLTPPGWRDRRGNQPAERLHTVGYELTAIPLLFNGNYHLHCYPTLGRVLGQLRPDVVHVDEEPYNLATFLAVRAALAVTAKPIFFTWQNLYRRYPPPFRWFERSVYRACHAAIAGNGDAASVLQRKGYAHRVTVLPQFGVDPAIFRPRAMNSGGPTTDDTQSATPSTDQTILLSPTAPPLSPPAPPLSPPAPRSPLHIGYAGGLLPEKGLDILLRACAGLSGHWRLTLVGSGTEEEALGRLAERLGIRERLTLGAKLPSHEMPNFYRSLDVLVLPSRTRPNWKEQFGRVLIEAMACGVPVVGSDSGEIPQVIGDAGLIFPEEDENALRAHLQHLLSDPNERDRLAQAGRERVLANFTMTEIARGTVAVYNSLP